MHQVAVPTPTAKPVDEEVIEKESKEALSATSSMLSDDEEDSTSLSNESDLLFADEQDCASLPEFDSEQANVLKRLLLSPLEPDTEF